jgi:hypothetical protein
MATARQMHGFESPVGEQDWRLGASPPAEQSRTVTPL